MPALSQLAAVGAGGAIGAVARFAIQCIPSVASHHKVWLTLGINLAGCMLIGIAWALVEHFGPSRMLNQFVIGGLLGGFTTYSTFAWDGVSLLRNGEIASSLLYITLTLAGGLLISAVAFHITDKLLQS